MFTIDRKLTGDNIFKCIKESDYSYDEIANMLNLKTSRVIYEWTKGNKLPSIEKLFNLCEIFNVDVYDLVVFIR